MSALAPVYTQIKDLGDTEIPLEDVARSTEPKEEPKKEDSCCKDSKWCKDGKRSIVRRLCACACCFIVFGTILWLIAGIAVGSYFAVKTYRCVHPRHQAITTFTFSDDEVKEFDIGVVSGFINIRTCPHAEKVTLVAIRKASQPDLLDTMPLEKSLKEGVFKLNALAPSFDLKHCQSAQVELIIPERLAEKKHLSVKAQTILGRVTVNAPKHTFDKLAVYSNLGQVKAERVMAVQSIEAEANVGFVSANDILKAKTIALKAAVGSVCAHNLRADEVNVQVETGRAYLNYVHTKVSKISSQLGWISAWAFDVKSLDAQVDFGRLTIAPTASWNGKFSVESPYGWIDASHHKDAKAPLLEKNTPAVIAGQYGVDPKAKPEEVSSLTMKGIYAEVNFFIPAPERLHAQ